MKNVIKVLTVVAVIILLSVYGARALASEAETAEISFYIGSTLIKTETVEKDKPVSINGITAPRGYEITGWTVGENGEIFDSECGVKEDTALYARVKLLPPSFSLSSLDISYDGAFHSLSPVGLTHPLENEGSYSFEWYKNGSLISTERELAVKNAADSGSYFLKVIFNAGNDITEVISPSIYANIEKCTVKLPEIKDKEYNGKEQKADIQSNTLYTVKSNGGVLVGAYPVKIILTDPFNCKFEGTDKTEIDAEFKITKAENRFVTELTAYDVYIGTSPAVFAASRFGEVRLLYSKSLSGPFGENEPTEAGKYYVKAVTEESGNYTSVSSEIRSFSIINERAVSIEISSMPHKINYLAFDSFVPDGLVLKVTYNSGKTELITSERIKISYKEGSSLRSSHTSVSAEYLGCKTDIPVTVEKREYDITNILFENTEKEYNGESQSIEYSGRLPIGLDGIALECEVLGYGINAGIYSCALVFKTASTEYRIPQAIEAVLTVAPRSAEVVWSSEFYVYDGLLKCPAAYYLDIYGRKNNLSVDGGGINAGEHTALAINKDQNYRLLNSKVAYRIEKAELDLTDIYWTTADFTYDNTEKSVHLYGLPSGVKVIGYIDNTAVNAGVYTAKAVLSYDAENYKEPPEITLNWSIKKSEYDLSGFAFFDSKYIYDGSAHYPKLQGEMPIGLDGMRLEYRFSEGAVSVREGIKEITVSFYTESVNYSVPESILKTVEILPFGINVLWQNADFTYNGGPQLPSAICDFAELHIDGVGIDAGVYTAVCSSLNPDYFIMNSEYSYEIKKAENAFSVPPSVADVFEGSPPFPKAEALFGGVEFLYFSEEHVPLDYIPSDVGVYYVVAKSDGDKNHREIISEKLRFEIIEVVPISFFVTLLKEELTAFEMLSPSDFFAGFKNNDGSITEIPTSAVAVFYERENSLRATDKYITFTAGGFSTSVDVTVNKANYDTSKTSWTESEFYFDGVEKTATLINLPSGVSVLKYEGNSAILAGEYRISVILSYDEENYNYPSIPEGILKINKQPVPLPEIPTLVYNKNPQKPDIADTELYTVILTEYTEAGTYYCTLKLRDADNYTFQGFGESAKAEYKISPIILTVSVLDAERYLFEGIPEFKYQLISGEILNGDSVYAEFYVSEGLIYCRSQNPNYTFLVTPGRFTEHNRPSSEFIIISVTVTLAVIATALFILLAVLKKRRTVNKKEEPQKPEAEALMSAEDFEKILEVTPERADVLISDALAKSLLRKGRYTVYTDGRKKGILNIDTLSENFSAGEEIDVNILKSKKLVPSDTAHIKILARGTLDKPLKVYANDFSLSAVKMIALTGGEAIRVSTHRKKHKKEKIK